MSTVAGSHVFYGRAVEWGNPNWGKPGHEVHVAENGSYWGAGEHADGVVEP